MGARGKRGFPRGEGMADCRSGGKGDNLLMANGLAQMFCGFSFFRGLSVSRRWWLIVTGCQCRVYICDAKNLRPLWGG